MVDHRKQQRNRKEEHLIFWDSLITGLNHTGRMYRLGEDNIICIEGKK